MNTAIIFGNGGHAKVIISIIEVIYEKITCVDNSDPYLSDHHIFNNFENYKNNDFYIGLGDNLIRTRIFNSLKKLGVYPKTCISTSAYKANSAKVGKGSVICHGAILGPHSTIKNNVIINTLSSIDHDCIVGNNTHISAGVNLGGNVEIGMNCVLGLGSKILPDLKIGNNSVVMPGSVVFNSIENDVMVGGNPARAIKRLH